MSMRLSEEARSSVVRFLWECKAEFDDEFIDFLSELIWEEAIALPSSNGRKGKSICDILGSLLPSVNSNDLKDRVGSLLAEIRQRAKGCNDDLSGSDLRAAVALEADFTNWCLSSSQSAARVPSPYDPVFGSPDSGSNTTSSGGPEGRSSSISPTFGTGDDPLFDGSSSILNSSLGTRATSRSSLIAARYACEEWEQGINAYVGERDGLRGLSQRWEEKAGAGLKDRGVNVNGNFHVPAGTGSSEGLVDEGAYSPSGEERGCLPLGTCGHGNFGEIGSNGMPPSSVLASSSSSSPSSALLSTASSSVVSSGSLGETVRSQSPSLSPSLSDVSTSGQRQQEQQQQGQRQQQQQLSREGRLASSLAGSRQGMFSILNPNAVEFVPQTTKRTGGGHDDGSSSGPSSLDTISGAASVLSIDGLSFSESRQSSVNFNEENRPWLDNLPDDLLLSQDVRQDDVSLVDLLPPVDIFDYSDPIHPPINASLPSLNSTTANVSNGGWNLTASTPNSQLLGANAAVSLSGSQLQQSGNGYAGYNGINQRVPAALGSNYASNSNALRFMHQSHLREKLPGVGGAPSLGSAGPIPGQPSFGRTFGGDFVSEQQQQSTSAQGVKPQSQLPQPSVTRERQSQWLGNGHLDITSSLLEEATFPEEEDVDGDAVRTLAAQFPGFSAESLADIYYANGGDLASTIDLLNQLEVQDEVGASNHHHAQPPPLTASEFPALSSVDGINGHLHSAGLDVPGIGRVSRLDDGGEMRGVGRGAPSMDMRASGLPDFAAAVRKQVAQQSQWQFERNGLGDIGMGRGRNPAYAAAGNGGHGTDLRVHGTRLDQYGNGRGLHTQSSATNQWLDTGNAVATLYGELREEARDHARIRNMCFEQATRAYLTGNKVLAKELGVRGQWHNEQMKVAHAKAGESIFRQRNAASGYANAASGQGGILDLHGLHVNEALPLLKRELAALRATSQRLRQRQQIFVCVGTGHHTKGLRTPARLPAAVERCLVEEEHVHFAEAEPGLLHVVI